MYDFITGLSIVTSFSNAIKLHPRTHDDFYLTPEWYDRYHECADNFLVDFNIEFQQPAKNKAIFICKRDIPEQLWFSLFEPTEKEIESNDSCYFGVSYKTTIKQAQKRIHRLIELFEQSLAGKECPTGWTKEAVKTHEIFVQRDKLRKIEQGLRYFVGSDEIDLTFSGKEFPDIEEIENKDYIKEFEEKILAKYSKNTNAIPF